jgi:Fe-S cluster biogenesis protein NfuA
VFAGISADLRHGIGVAPHLCTARHSREANVVTKERIEAVLHRVRPFLQADGGDIELLSVDGTIANVRLTGVCAGCPSAQMTLYVGIESALKEDMPDFEGLRLHA